MEKYKIQKHLGSGAFSSVSKAINIETGETFAIKKFKKKYHTWEECLNLREIKSLSKLKHQNIIKLIEVIHCTPELNCVFEYLPQNLYQFYSDYKETGRMLSEPQIKSIIYQLAKGLAHMHKYGFFHRDLKPENLLLQDEELKIADFGLAREIRSRPPFTDYVATRWYRAPEILLKSINYNSPVDIWALGCILAELYQLNPLFPGNSEIDQLNRICVFLGGPQETWKEGLILASKINFYFPSMVGNFNITGISSAGLSLVKEILKWDPNKRLSISAILQHEFFNEIMICQVDMIKYDDKKHNGEKKEFKDSLKKNSEENPKEVFNLNKKKIIEEENKKIVEPNFPIRKISPFKPPHIISKIEDQFKNIDVNSISPKYFSPRSANINIFKEKRSLGGNEYLNLNFRNNKQESDDVYHPLNIEKKPVKNEVQKNELFKISTENGSHKILKKDEEDIEMPLFIEKTSNYSIKTKFSPNKKNEILTNFNISEEDKLKINSDSLSPHSKKIIINEDESPKTKKKNEEEIEIPIILDKNINYYSKNKFSPTKNEIFNKINLYDEEKIRRTSDSLSPLSKKNYDNFNPVQSDKIFMKNNQISNNTINNNNNNDFEIILPSFQEKCEVTSLHNYKSYIGSEDTNDFKEIKIFPHKNELIFSKISISGEENNKNNDLSSQNSNNMITPDRINKDNFSFFQEKNNNNIVNNVDDHKPRIIANSVISTPNDEEKPKFRIKKKIVNPIMNNIEINSQSNSPYKQFQSKPNEDIRNLIKTATKSTRKKDFDSFTPDNQIDLNDKRSQKRSNFLETKNFPEYPNSVKSSPNYKKYIGRNLEEKGGDSLDVELEKQLKMDKIKLKLPTINFVNKLNDVNIGENKANIHRLMINPKKKPVF